MSLPTPLTILQGDCIEQMRTLPEASVQCCVTSPPYWGLRDYGVDGQIGLDPDYVEMGKRRCNITPGLALA